MYSHKTIELVHCCHVLVVTKNLCNEKNSSNDRLQKHLVKFCSNNINSDKLLDLIAEFSEYHRLISNNEPACLYYGFTSRKLKSQNSKATTLGNFKIANHFI